MNRLLYDLFILLYEMAAWLISPFNRKARLWLRGRIKWAAKLEQQITHCQLHSRGEIVWMHASSLGEFEQGKPVLDALKKNYPEIRVVVSFFSPSGYEVVKHTEVADIVTYLPTDTPGNAQHFVDLVKPKLVLWVKYDYWFHHLKTLNSSKIPVLLISSIIWNDSVFVRWYGGLHRSMLHFFRHVFVQNEASAEILSEVFTKEKIDHQKLSIGGDTRFDRVIDIAKNWQPVHPVEEWLGGETKVLVAGSTWPEDDEELVHFVKNNPGKKIIIAPHHVEAEALKDCMETFGELVLFSDLVNGTVSSSSNLLLINNVGLLSRLYRYGLVCYVGGGFSGTGIHNVLEAAVYGKPVVHGPEHERYQEAVDLLTAGGSFVVDSAITLEKRLDLLFSNEAENKKAAEAAKEFVHRYQGSTQKIIDFIYENRLLTRL